MIRSGERLCCRMLSGSLSGRNLLQPAVQARSTPWPNYQHPVLSEHLRTPGTVEWISIQAIPHERYSKIAGRHVGIVGDSIWRRPQLLSLLFFVSESTAFGESMWMQGCKHAVNRAGEANQPGVWFCSYS